MAYLDNWSDKFGEKSWHLEKFGPEVVNKVDNKPFDVRTIVILEKNIKIRNTLPFVTEVPLLEEENNLATEYLVSHYHQATITK